MRTMDEEYNRTTKKMADAVMEYASQFVARGFLDEYMRADAARANVFVPESLDEAINQKISQLPRRQKGWIRRLVRKIALGILGVFVLFCVGITGFVLFSEPLRNDLILTIFGG